MKSWKLTEKHRRQIPEWNRRWIDIIMSTAPIDIARTAEAVRAMYRAAGLSTDDLRIVRARSAIEGMIVHAYAAAWWSLFGDKACSEPAAAAAAGSKAHDETLIATLAATHAETHAETRLATRVATHDATRDATWDATYAATRNATLAATLTATRDATYAATRDATLAATLTATWDATYAATRDATRAAMLAATLDATLDATLATTLAAMRAATRDSIRAATRAATLEFGNRDIFTAMHCAAESVFPQEYRATARALAIENMQAMAAYSGGSEWASWCAYLSFVRDVIGWKHPSHENYAHYEAASIHGGPRFMHKKFVVLCERALTRKIDDQNRPHSEDGPAITWRCGSRLYCLHGVRVDEQVVMRPETQTIKQIESEPNSEVKRLRIERFGWERYLRESGARVLCSRLNERDMQFEQLYVLSDGAKRFVCVDPSTGRKYSLGVPRAVDSCQAAQDWLSHGLDRRAVHRS